MEDPRTDRSSFRSPWWAILVGRWLGHARVQPLQAPDRRTGDDRRTQPDQAGGDRVRQRRDRQRRQQPRRLMPFGGVAPSGRLCFQDQGCVHADLVDISDGGVCVMLSTTIAVACGDALELTLHENFGSGSIQLDLELCWQIETPVGLKLGCRFRDPQFAPSATFLKRYLDTDFSDDRRSLH